MSDKLLPGPMGTEFRAERTFTSEQLALNQAAIVRKAAEHFPLWDEEVWRLECSCGWKCPAQCNEREYKAIFKQHILAIPTDQPALDRYVAGRYITREEHNNIIRMNETVHERDVAERVREAVLKEAEWWAEYGHTLSDKRARLAAAARAPIVTKEQLGIVTDDEGNDHWGIQPQPGAPGEGNER